MKKRKRSRQIGDSVERQCVAEFEQQGYVAFRVPNPRRNFNAKFQQKGPYSSWDVVVIEKAMIIQCKRRKKYMSKDDIDVHVKSSKLWPKTKLIPMLCFRDRGLKYESY